MLKNHIENQHLGKEKQRNVYKFDRKLPSLF